MAVDPKKLDAALSAIAGKYGDTIHTGDKEPDVPRLTTGSLDIDYATGGGIPVGRMSHLWGSFSSGKSFTSWNVAREALSQGMTVAYYNVEKSYDKAWVEEIGVPTKDLLIVDGTTIEEVGTKLEALMGSVHLHIIDSISSAVAVDELGSNLEDWHIGLAARAWGKVFRRALERFDQHENTIIAINQAREAFGMKSEQPPGGRYIEHSSSMTLYFRKGSWLFRDKHGFLSRDASPEKVQSGMTEPAGIEYKIRVNKSRVGRPLRQASIYYDFKSGSIEVEAEYARAAKFHNIVQTSGSWITLPDGQKVQGEGQLRQYIRDNPDFASEIYSVVMAEG